VTIRLLSPGVAGGIAAGEVIERPASVVKELVENSIDSGATSVTVGIQQGGLQSIRVTDDGSGIPAGEVNLAFERHATSKLVSLEGLTSIATLGFRGEALASIAAAAHVRMVTRTAEAITATVVNVAGGLFLHEPSESAAQGTQIVVEALFSSIPARLKFIKSTPAETARIRQVIEHMAVASPHVRFCLTSERRTLVQTSGNGELRDVLANLHGTEIAERAIEVASSARAPYAAHGMVAPPDYNRPNRNGISLFVNGRWIISGSLNAAIREAYRGLLMEGRFPFAVMFVDIPPELIDVNVHPNKREVRFRHDRDVFSSVERSVREALLSAHPDVEARGLFTLGPAAQPLSPSQVGGNVLLQSFDFTLNPVTDALLPEPSGQAIRVTPDDVISSIDVPSRAQDNSSFSLLRVLGQISNTYIVVETSDGMQLIDQHAAHESILYYRLLSQWRERYPEVQFLLDPLPIELSPDQIDTLSKADSVLERYGILLEPFGDATWLLRSIPAMARTVSATGLVLDILEATKGSEGTLPDVQHVVTASIACHSAIRAGQSLGMQEMEALTNALVAETNPQHCPHGRPATLRVTIGMLEREFGRT